MRAFLAFDIDENNKKKIKNIINSNFKKLKKINKLKEKGKIKQVKDKDYHITFLFFAMLDDNNYNAIRKIFKEKLIFKPFKTKIKGVSFFKNEENIRVIYLEIEENEKLSFYLNIYKRLFKELNLSFNEIKQLENLKPHITLFRLKNPVNFETLEEDLLLLNELFKGIEIEISDFCLYKSTLLRTGPVYEKLISAVEKIRDNN